jgi:Holliday junction resolvase RusA-like endonuclease
MAKKWIQKAIKRRGRVRRYIKRLFGGKAFYDGIKVEYLKKAIQKIRKNKKMKKREKKSLIGALNLAIRLKKMVKKRKRGKK